MKFLFAILILGVFVELSYAKTKEAAMELLFEYMNSCKATTGATDDDVNIFKKYEVADNYIAKCFTACVMKATAFMSPEHKINKTAFISYTEHLFTFSPAEFKIAEEIADECLNVTDSDECEAAFKIGSCLQTGRETKGLVLKF